MEEFLIKDYDNVEVDDGEKAKIRIVDEKELWEIFQKAKDKEEFPLIAIYKIGECVLDWS